MEMTRSFEHMSKEYQTLEAPRKEDNYRRTMLSREDNDKVNEIFDEFSDIDDGNGTIH